MKKLPIIWALYDDAESSYNKAIKRYFDKKFIIYSIGINDLVFEKSKYYFYKKIDLSLINFNLIKELNKLPRPDIILASPPCESWSGADCGGVMVKSITKNGEWVIKNKKYYDKYNEKAHPVKRRKFIQKETSRILGEATIGATIKIIEEFKPKYWVIENPFTSKTWKFQEFHWNFGNKAFHNKTYYSSYDKNFSSKPTIFKSNINLNLKSKKEIGNKNHMLKGSYSKRSAIPKLLIKKIIDELLIKIESHKNNKGENNE